MTGPTHRVLSENEVLSRLKSRRGQPGYLAMFSSWLGGVITDPALMQIPLDDHLVHRGHGVFDTCTLSGGNLYRLGVHMDRLLTSAALARIEHSWTKEDLIQMVMDTASHARVKDGAVRYWLTAGPGGFSPSPQECDEPCFYCVIIDPVPLGGCRLMRSGRIRTSGCLLSICDGASISSVAPATWIVTVLPPDLTTLAGRMLDWPMNSAMNLFAGVR